MKEVTNIKMVYVTFSELLSYLNVETNRCGYTTKEEANLNGFSDEDYNKFVRRALKIMKSIKKHGWKKSSFFTICRDEENNIYLLDGQGRRMALKLMAEKYNSDFSSWTFLCKYHINPMTKEEMSEEVVNLNTGNKNWNNEELFRSYAMQSGDKSVMEAFKETKRIKDKLGVSDKTAKLLTFGEKASHLRSSGNGPLSESDYAITKDLYTNCMETIINGLSYKFDKDGNKVLRKAKTLEKIRRDNFTTGLITCFRKIVKQSGNNDHPSNAKDDLMYFADAVIRAGSGSDDFVAQFTHCDKPDYNLIASQIKKNVKNNKTICNALYSEN